MKGNVFYKRTAALMLAGMTALTMMPAGAFAATKAPARVTGVKVVKVGADSAKVSWKKASRASRYEVLLKYPHWGKQIRITKAAYRKLAKHRPNNVRITSGRKNGKRVYYKQTYYQYYTYHKTTRRSMTILGLEEKTTYRIKVRGWNKKGKGKTSKSIAFRTLAEDNGSGSGDSGSSSSGTGTVTPSPSDEQGSGNSGNASSGTGTVTPSPSDGQGSGNSGSGSSGNTGSQEQGNKQGGQSASTGNTGSTSTQDQEKAKEREKAKAAAKAKMDAAEEAQKKADEAYQKASQAYESAKADADQKVSAAQKKYDEAGLHFMEEQTGVTYEELTAPGKVSENAAITNTAEFDQVLRSGFKPENLDRAIELIDECNEIRINDPDAYENESEDGKSLKVSPHMMMQEAYATAMFVYIKDHVVNHNRTTYMPSALISKNRYAENLAGSFKDPYTAWYTSEKEVHDKARGSMTYDEFRHWTWNRTDEEFIEKTGMTRSAFKSRTGHYVNLMSGHAVTGFGVVDTPRGRHCGSHCYGQNFGWISSLPEGADAKVMTTSEFSSALHAYTANDKAELDQAKADAEKETASLKSAEDAAKKAADDARASYDQARAAYQALL